MKAKEKIEKWLDECGYVTGKSLIVLKEAYALDPISIRTYKYLKSDRILSLNTTDGKVHIPPADLHEDDPEPERSEDIPRDKALQEYVRTGFGTNCMLIELNNRIKALESILLDGGKGE